MADRTAKATLAEEVYSRLRTRLLGGMLPPGSKLKLGDFSAQFGVSLSVVREAMTRLAEQGLVQASPQRGFTVTPLSVDDLLDLTRARVLIETLTLRESIRVGDLAWESATLAAHHTLARTPMLTSEGHVDPAFSQAHQAFHHSLLAGSGSRRLEAIATELRDHSTMYQHWSQELPHDVDRDLAAEHRAIAECTLARDEEGAARALRDHIERTTAILVRHAEQVASHAEDHDLAWATSPVDD